MAVLTRSLLAVVGIAVVSSAQEQLLVAGRDVQTPRRIHAPPPTYPPIARNTGLQGLILLEITVSTEGRPTNIKVLRGIPLLDEAAIDAVRNWRYEPTLVDGMPRQVALLEGLDFFATESSMAGAYANIAASRREPSAFRVYAISRLEELPAKRQKMVRKTLQKLLNDPDAVVSGAAESALAKLPIEAK